MNNKTIKNKLIINIVEKNQPSQESINNYNNQLKKIFERKNISMYSK